MSSTLTGKRSDRDIETTGRQKLKIGNVRNPAEVHEIAANLKPQ